MVGGGSQSSSDKEPDRPPDGAATATPASTTTPKTTGIFGSSTLTPTVTVPDLNAEIRNHPLYSVMTKPRGINGNIPSNSPTNNEDKKMRSFAEIIAEETANRNILVIKLTKITDENGAKAPNLSMEDVGELMFDMMKLAAADCKSVALHTSRYDTKEVLLKPRVDPSPYLTTVPFVFKGHEVSVSRQLSCVT